MRPALALAFATAGISQRGRRRGFIAFAALSALAFALPGVAGVAHAQPLPTPSVVEPVLSVSVEDPGHTMAPSKNETLQVLVSYQVGPSAVPAKGDNPDPTTGDPNSPNNTQRTKIHFAMKKTPSWVANVSFVPAVVDMRADVGGSTHTAIVQLILRIDARAPALVKEELVIVANADPNGNIGPKSAESPSINLKPAFVARANITPASEAVIVPGGRWTEVSFVVKNLGNGESKMKLNVTARPQDSQVEFPQSVTVARDGQQTVVVRLRLPWTYGEGGTLELEALPLTDDDSGKATKGDVEVLGQSAVPGVSPLVAIALLALVAIALRRR